MWCACVIHNREQCTTSHSFVSFFSRSPIICSLTVSLPTHLNIYISIMVILMGFAFGAWRTCNEMHLMPTANLFSLNLWSFLYWNREDQQTKKFSTFSIVKKFNSIQFNRQKNVWTVKLRFAGKWNQVWFNFFRENSREIPKKSRFNYFNAIGELKERLWIYV